MSTDPRVDAYIAKQAEFARPILIELRRRMHAARPDFVEAIKWSMPFFELDGRPFANMAGFKAHASFGFWKQHELGIGGEGEAMGQFGRLTSVDDLPGEAAFASMVDRAVAALETVAPKPRGESKGEAEVPAALAEALAGDDLAAATFNAFSPSARRDYCEWIADAMRDSTRDKRIADAIEWMRDGKKRHWKYETC